MTAAVFEFMPATKESAKARVALAGPSGSGKTYTALLVAQAFGQKTALIDTERGSAAKYADEFQFDTLQMHVFEPQSLVRAIAAAGAAHYDTLIIDSLSHFWQGTGGMIDQADAAGKRNYGGNSFAGWKDVRPVEMQMIDAMLAYPGHVIVTLRTKTEWVIEDNERGKKQPRKIGTKPIQREGIEYEFDVVGDLDHSNTLVISKSRCKALTNAVIQLPNAENFGQPLLDWVTAGTAPSKTADDYLVEALRPDATMEDMRSLHAELKRRNLLNAAVMDADGQPTMLGELVVRRGQAMREASQPSTAVDKHVDAVNTAVAVLGAEVVDEGAPAEGEK